MALSEKKRTDIILFCPVREPPAFLEHSLRSHERLEGVRQRVYLDDNEPITEEGRKASGLLHVESETAEMVNADKPVIVCPGRMVDMLGSIGVGEKYSGHQWTNTLMSRMQRVRNYGLSWLAGSNAEAILMVDSDVLLHPETAIRLLDTGAEIISEIFWSKWELHMPWLPNVWDMHNYGFFEKGNITRLREPGVYRVGGLGAVTLIRREALAKRISYSEVYGLPFPGEDRHFCTRASAVGIELWVDTTLPAFHVYRPGMLGEGAMWMEAGCPPEYFRDKWLGEDWVRDIDGALGD